MELQEFIRLKPSEIRRDSNLMQLFVSFYEAAFLVKPSCAGCVFKTGFERLKTHALKNGSKQIKQIVMSSKTFLLKNEYKLKILNYKKNGKTYRCYGYNLTEEFAKELVNAGQEKLFIKLPDVNENDKEGDNIEVMDFDQTEKQSKYYSMNYRDEVLPLYAKLKEEKGGMAKSNKKDDIISFIVEHEG